MLAGPPPTAAEVRDAFEDILAASARGESPAVIPCYGFDTAAVLQTLMRVQEAAPKPPVELLEAARAAFAADNPW